ncbi:hypothetical protein DUNSADRAFT_6373 [Dunaliella salina]|uniref:Uncharacterized protein n=1 Tax=Dunaliella salina TaxID=3046 RepID=A0ABQ7GND6_DUNSA|nr:hypothetical protein DUNSADRAFT_6373 [Dunaliella salina]|eukprot:KAF5836120.1 hypothetical protein DUNSADRAFT_6373 [Dunaliella salina]
MTPTTRLAPLIVLLGVLGITTPVHTRSLKDYVQKVLVPIDECYEGKFPWLPGSLHDSYNGGCDNCASKGDAADLCSTCLRVYETLYNQSFPDDRFPEYKSGCLNCAAYESDTNGTCPECLQRFYSSGLPPSRFYEYRDGCVGCMAKGGNSLRCFQCLDDFNKTGLPEDQFYVYRDGCLKCANKADPMNDVCSTCMEDATSMFEKGFPMDKFYQYRDGCVSCGDYSDPNAECPTCLKNFNKGDVSEGCTKCHNDFDAMDLTPSYLQTHQSACHGCSDLDETITGECFECVSKWPTLGMSDSYYSYFESGCKNCGGKSAYEKPCMTCVEEFPGHLAKDHPDLLDDYASACGSCTSKGGKATNCMDCLKSYPEDSDKTFSEYKNMCLNL